MRLEDQLGFRLFNRTTRGAHPTDLAMPFIAAARQIINDLDGLQQQAQTWRRGRIERLALGYSGSLFTGKLTPSLSTFMKLYPDIQFDGFERSPQRLFAALSSGLVDAIIAPCSLATAKVLQMPLWQEPVRVCFPSSHRFSTIDPIRWSDMRQEHLVLPAGGLGPAIRELLALRLGDCADETDVSFQQTGSDGIFGLVSITGKATLTTHAVPAQLTGEVHCRDVHEQSGPAHIDFALHWCRDNPNPALRCLRDVLSKNVISLKTSEAGRLRQRSRTL